MKNVDLISIVCDSCSCQKKAFLAPQHRSEVIATNGLNMMNAGELQNCVGFIFRKISLQNTLIKSKKLGGKCFHNESLKCLFINVNIPEVIHF